MKSETSSSETSEYTTQRAVWFNLPLQGEDESSLAFRERIAGSLRDQGHFIEAHEALNNCLYDDPAANANGCGPMVGIMGALAQELYGVDYGSGHSLGDDIAAGVVSRRPREDPNMLAMMLNAAKRGK